MYLGLLVYNWTKKCSKVLTDLLCQVYNTLSYDHLRLRRNIILLENECRVFDKLIPKIRLAGCLEQNFANDLGLLLSGIQVVAPR